MLYFIKIKLQDVSPDCLTFSLHQYKIQQTYPLYILLGLIAVLLLGHCRQIH